MCPYIAGQWPTPEGPSLTENNGIMIDEADVEGFPPTVISVNECDPLRDDADQFLPAPAARWCPGPRPAGHGPMHGTEIFTIACPEISRDTARDLAAFRKD